MTTRSRQRIGASASAGERNEAPSPVTSLMGDNAYATYLAHHRRTHPGIEPLTERQFWRQRMDDQDRNPGARCC
ncbi:YbdD/YjiX family protein [Microbacterium oleivorans]|uniref:YbdD/YjiX family protein n=2 Tax=Microbacterium oleivorans TaxID=273677 RepID=A0A7D5EU24_9MICO|nr:YbdD/YjiX family protein [Microbacterium oleivorans]